MRISELPREEYEGYELVFSYTSRAYYDLRLRQSKNVFSAEFVKTPRPAVHKEFSDKLFAPYWDDPHVFGLWDETQLVAMMEVTPEKWNNRLRITNICVLEGRRRRGYGSLLITKAREVARAWGCRAIILETHSCNTDAIAFYLDQGFSFMGFNACEYSNEDLQKQEIRIEMGYLMT